MDTAQNRATRKSALWITAKIIRILTVPPIMAIAAFTIFLFTDGFYENIWEYVAAVVFIALLPIMAYPLQLIIPPFKHQGREGQRNLALIMSNVGYILSIIYALAFSAGRTILTIFLTYLLSGMLLLVINKLFGFKASGHACGSMGPVACLAYFSGPAALIAGIVVFFLALWSSIYMKRHTLSQFIVGAVIPVALLMVNVNILL